MKKKKKLFAHADANVRFKVEIIIMMTLNIMTKKYMHLE